MTARLTNRIFYGSPHNADEWNKLAAMCGEFQQSTYVDDSQKYFKQLPVYIEIYSDQCLAGGVKCYIYRSRRFIVKNLNASLAQTSEILVNPDIQDKGLVIEYCIGQLKDLIKRENIVFSKHSMNFGYGDRIPGAGFAAINSIIEYMIGYAELSVTEEELWRKLSENRRRSIRNAEKEGLQFIEEDNIDLFLDLISATYSVQQKSGPDHNYLRMLYDDMKGIGIMKAYFVRNSDRFLSGALICYFGDIAYYCFGGNLQDSGGAGSLLHWKLMLLARSMGYRSYCFGQLAAPGVPASDKFTNGITSFKRRFGLVEYPAKSIIFVHNRVFYNIWMIMKKLSGIR